MLLLVLFSFGAGAKEVVLFQVKDPGGDDYGAGRLTYPSHGVYHAGLFDLEEFRVASDADSLFFDFQFATLTNPFGAPEGFFHQRIEVYVSTGAIGGSEAISLGSHQFQTSPGFSWDLHLQVAPFGESALWLYKAGARQKLPGDATCFALTDQRLIRLQLAKNLIPDHNSSWRYIVLVGAFDGLAVDFWRDLGPSPWELGGEGPPIFDLLAPRFGAKNQKHQLASGVFHPVGEGRNWLAPVLSGALGVGVLVGGIVLWRWTHGRT